jgi:ubiquinone/menaquinone biosynthesis C-methylase UbiE
VFVRVQEVTSKADLEEVYRFRYRVYVDELHKPLPSADHERRVVTDELDEHARVLVAVDDSAGNIVGTVRTMFGARHPLPDEILDRLKLRPMVAALGMEHITHSGTFMVDPAYRGLTIASQLVMHMVQLGFEVDTLADVCVAELALVKPYYQLGYRPYAAPFRPHDRAGLRVPLVWTVRDRDYLREVDSPFGHIISSEQDDHGVTAREIADLYGEFRNPKVTPRRLREFWAAFAHSSPAYRAPSVFSEIEQDVVDEVLGGLPTLTIAAGERLYRRGEHEQGMALLLSGKLGVTLDDTGDPFFFSVLVPGEVCGEMASHRPDGRSAFLVAVEDTEVLLLPADLADKVERKHPGLGNEVRDNLMSVLAWRLDAMNHHVVGLNRGNPERIPLDPRPMGTDLTERVDASASYSISTLDDSVTELERLEKQAAIAQQLEAVWFKRVGCSDGARILDLGSGPGVTTTLLARTFPASTVVGVEPDGRLRRRAGSRAEQLGLANRCTFVEGTGEAIPLEDASMDFAYARFLAQHLNEPARTLAELRRVVAPGGTAALLDVDDAGVVIHPEPLGLAEFQARVARAQQELGGDRHVGRKLVAYLADAGFESPRTEVVPLSSHHLPLGDLVDIAFSFKAQTLRRVGAWQDSDEQLLAQLANGGPGCWLYIPVFLGHARVPR